MIFGIVLFTLLVQGTSAGRVIAWAGVATSRTADSHAHKELTSQQE